jgi:hypothetical protein
MHNIVEKKEEAEKGGGRWARGQCAQRAIAEAKQRP